MDEWLPCDKLGCNGDFKGIFSQTQTVASLRCPFTFKFILDFGIAQEYNNSKWVE